MAFMALMAFLVDEVQAMDHPDLAIKMLPALPSL